MGFYLNKVSLSVTLLILKKQQIMLLRRLINNARVHVSRRTKVLVTRPDYPRLDPGRFHSHPPNKPLSPKELIGAVGIMSVSMWFPAFAALQFNKKVRPNK